MLDEDDARIPLASHKLSNADFSVNIYLDYDGAIMANLTMAVDGELGSFANQISLADFSMAIEAKTPSPAVD